MRSKMLFVIQIVIYLDLLFIAGSLKSGEKIFSVRCKGCVDHRILNK